MKRLIFRKVPILVVVYLLAVHPSLSQNGLHGYLASYPSQAPASYVEGYGFYSAIWPLVSTPIYHFQIGLPSTWIIPDNSDNSTEPLCPIGTVARDNWPERGPTYSSVFQTVEGGPGYWAGNKFHYGPPKFKMNSTPNCYSEEISTPGWRFFWSDDPLPDDMLGIAQISNAILIPPDGMTFEGNPNGEILGIAYMALPLTSPYTDEYPVGEKSWTLFLNSTNFKGPLAYYLPETWAKISKDYPFDNGRGLDARPSVRNLAGGTMEINTVPMKSATNLDGKTYYKIPKLQFPVNNENRTILALDVTFYNREILYDKILDWRNGGQMPSGSFPRRGSYKPNVHTYPVTYNQAGKTIIGINELAKPQVFRGNEFGLQWSGNSAEDMRYFPSYYTDSAEYRIAIPDSMVPPYTGLRHYEFPKPSENPSPYKAELQGAWRFPGPVAGPFFAYLNDHSMVTYFWYRFIDQPVFQQYNWSQTKKDSLQHLIEEMHEHWHIDGTYLQDPTSGELVGFDKALLVSPPPEFSVGYVPIVVAQEKSEHSYAGLPDKKQSQVLVYPNPASEYLKIFSINSLQEVREVRFLDLNGKVLQKFLTTESGMELDIRNLSAGVYFLQYSDGKQTVTTKIVKTE